MMAACKRKECLVGGNKMFMKSQFVTSPGVIPGACPRLTGMTGNLLFFFDRFFKRVQIETVNPNTMQHNLVVAFATLKTTVNYHFRESTKMIACGRNFRPQSHFVGIIK